MKNSTILGFRCIVVPIFLLVVCLSRLSIAQSRISTNIETHRSIGSGLPARDFWLTSAKNYVNQGGKYIMLFISSKKNTTVKIQVAGGAEMSFPSTANQVINFQVPSDWEITSSGIVEKKAIHVWSNDADLVVNLLSKNPASSDGMLVLPTSGWGKEYVVASYQSYFEGYGTFVYDYPSEYCIVANEDNTNCTIIPNGDIRADSTGTKILHKSGVPFSETLNRGECVQYQLTRVTNGTDFDATGSVVTASNPIGVIGASQCSNIPAEYPYCDYICDMMQPVRSWGRKYLTLPFANRRGGDTYLTISSKPNQIIYRNGKAYAAFTQKYESYFRPDITEASYWTSDAPFLLAQYINSTTWKDNSGQDNAGIGYPSMVMINAVEEFPNNFVFMTPNIQGTGGFQNFANIFVQNNAISGTTLDDKPIATFANSKRIELVNSNYTGIVVKSLTPGKHEVHSDSGVGAYVYGYGDYDSYAWSGNLGQSISDRSDSVSPMTSISGDCLKEHVRFSDSLISDSKLNSVVSDTIFNMSFALDPLFMTGAGIGSSFYDLQVIDPTLDAFAAISIYDFAGNRTTVTSSYRAEVVKIDRPIVNFGVRILSTHSCDTLSISNLGSTSFSIKNIRLASGNFGFTLDSIGLLDSLPPGAMRKLIICFTPLSSATVTDTVLISDGCIIIRSVIYGNGGSPDFKLTANNFECTPLGVAITDSATIAINFSKVAVAVDSIWFDDAVHFAFIGVPALPVIIGPSQSRAFLFSFSPTSSGNISTTVHFRSPDVGERTAQVSGCVKQGASVQAAGYISSLSKTGSEYSRLSAQLTRGEMICLLPPIPNPISRTENRSIRFDYALSEVSSLKLSLYDILGKEVAAAFDELNHPAGIYESRLALPQGLPNGNYIYQLSSSSKVISGNIIIVQ